MTNPVAQMTTQFLRRLFGGAAGYPARLAFHSEQENILYIDVGTGATNANVAILAGSVLKLADVGAFVDLAWAQVIAGKKTFSLSQPVPNGSTPAMPRLSGRSRSR